MTAKTAPDPTPEPRPLSISDCTERDYAINGRTMYSIKPEAGTPEPPRLPVKNRNIPGGKEFWNHVEDVAKNLQPPLWGSPRCPKCGSDDRTIHKRLRIEPMSEFDPPDDCECFDPWHKGETPSALSAALVKLNNYLLAHQKGIDMRWVGHVLEEATQEAADLRSKLSESEKWRLIGIGQMKEWEEQLSTAERERDELARQVMIYSKNHARAVAAEAELARVTAELNGLRVELAHRAQERERKGE